MTGARGGPGGTRRPPVRKPHVAVSPRARLVRSLPSAPRRPEGIRWLRSDGSPNWSQRIASVKSDITELASRPPITISTSSTILEATEVIATHKVRGLVLADAKGFLKGVLMATDIVNYLGGGEYYSIVRYRYSGNVFRALRDESVSSIANPSPFYVVKTDSLLDTIKLMVVEGVGFLPVVNEEGVVYGVITEHDIVRTYMPGTYTGVKVGEIASKNIVVAGVEDSLKKAAELMIKHGFRRLPVVGNDGSIKGLLTAKDYVEFFGSHRAFDFVVSGDIEEVLKVPVYEVMKPGVITIEEDADASEAARVMKEHGVSSLIVVDKEGNAVGIVTERDLLTAVVLERGA
jgi:CBS domain-containing protein